MEKKDLKKINDYVWEIPKGFRRDMRVLARVYADEKILEKVLQDRSLEQLINVSTLPGIVNYALAMPDMHEGYGFPIGGVAAMRSEDGVISPGGVGYDINCTSGDTRVLLEHGAYLSIKRIKDRWQNTQVNHLELNGLRLNTSPLTHFLEKYSNPSIYQIVTRTDKKIKVTEEHPIYTPKGMKEAKLLKKGERVAVLPFGGVRYEDPSNKIILSENNFKKVLIKIGKSVRGSALQQILIYLRNRNIFPLKYNSWQKPYLLKLMGFILGDGSISFVGRNKKGTVWFYGHPEDLENIAQDVKKIGFTPSRIYKRTRKHEIKTFYKKYKFVRTEYSIKVVSSAFATLLVALGVPYGLKTDKKYVIPKWIFDCRLWQKRLFLSAFFGAELSSPTTLNKYNFCAPQLNMSKDIKLLSNAKYFLKQIVALLKEFKVICAPIATVNGYRHKGKRSDTLGLRLIILGALPNLLNLFEKIGYEYNKTKQKEACLAAHYLRLKIRTTSLRAKTRKRAQILYNQGQKPKKIIEELSDYYTPPQFIGHSLFASRRGNPRIAFNFPSFREFKEKFAFGKNGLVWDRIEKIKKVSFKDYVYDFTVAHSDHNFIANNFVVSNCGVRMVRSEIFEKDLQPHLEKLMDGIYQGVPSGVGRGGKVKLNPESMKQVLERGVSYVVEKGYGKKEDIEHCEEDGTMAGADAQFVSERAKSRGRDQLGTLGSGNHFIEIQKVDEIFDEKIADIFGLKKDLITIMIHSGSRGLGHQVCTDYVKIMLQALSKYKIKLPDRELACAPLSSSEGKKYFSAMAASANYAWANRQLIMHLVRQIWQKVLGETGKNLHLIYDVAHNIAKMEKHQDEELCIHRKGATRAFGSDRKEVPVVYQNIGQPILIPGTMGTASYILVGTKEAERQTFASVCHGAGRMMSRHAAIKLIQGNQLRQDLQKQGIVVRCLSNRGLAEEAPLAYKDIHNVVDVVVKADLAKLVARLKPLGVLKG